MAERVALSVVILDERTVVVRNEAGDERGRVDLPADGGPLSATIEDVIQDVTGDLTDLVRELNRDLNGRSGGR